jgi:KDO2-lipid IV(A) lauroyltransferase
MYVVNMWYEPDHCWGSLDLVPMPDPGSGPLNQRVRQMTQSMADRLAAGIAKHPADWHMLARMFTPPGETDGDPETSKPAGEAAVTG